MSTPTLGRRPYGPDHIPLSIVGFGGIVVTNAEQSHANRTVARAVERGVNYFDVSPNYGDAEIKLGPALEPFRDECFLACKTIHRGRQEAEADFKRSLERLRTDHFDLYQLHAITDMEKDVEAALAPGGVLELVSELKQAGLVRHVGFSAHSVEAALALMDRYPFDSILFPVNFATYYQADFGPSVIADARQRGLSILAIKGLAQCKWPKDDPLRERFAKCWYRPVTDAHLASLAVRFTLSQPVTAMVCPGEEEMLWLAVEMAENFTPITEPGIEELRQAAAEPEPVFGP